MKEYLQQLVQIMMFPVAETWEYDFMTENFWQICAHICEGNIW